MSNRSTQPPSGSDDHKVYVGALVPLRFYTRLVEEAEQAGVSRSEVLRWALAERYDGVQKNPSASLRTGKGHPGAEEQER